ncbi:MAG: hypothetical protein AABX94_01160, partial [Nanoarchaeota archaeon]
MGLRGLVLGGAVAVSSFSLSGCWAALPAGYIYLHSQAENSKREAEAQKEAARTIADAVKGQNGSSGNVGSGHANPVSYSSQTERDIA